MPTRPAILFDLDGTLVDTIALLLASMRHAFTSCGVACPTDAQWTAGIGTPLGTQFRDFVQDDATVARLITAYRAYQHEHHDALTSAYDGIPALVARLEERGHPIKGAELDRPQSANRGVRERLVLSGVPEQPEDLVQRHEERNGSDVRERQEGILEVDLEQRGVLVPAL
jgi:phosphoglycolate phosphatase-like HAD superfamily hydrolase